MQPPLSRDEFAVTQRYTYLNHAAVGVLPQTTKRAIDAFVQAQADGGVLGTYKIENRIPEFRERIGKFIGASGGEIALMRNTSHGANVLAGGIDVQPGDEILLCDDEFPANVLPWFALRDKGAHLRFLPTRESGKRLTPQLLREEISSRTKIVTVSWVNFADGYRHDLAALAEIAHAHGALCIVDVIQGLGALPLDVHACNVDAAFGGGAKWLLSLHGSGWLYVHPNLLDRLHLEAPGWRAVANMWDFYDYDQAWLPNAARFEGGVPNFVGALSLATSIELLERHDTAKIGAHILALTDRLCEGLQRAGATTLTERGEGISSGIVTFTFPDRDPIALGRSLQHDHQIVTTYRANGIRVAPHGYNTVDEIDTILGAITASVMP